MYTALYKLYFVLWRKKKKRENIKRNKNSIIEWLLGYIEAYYNLYVRKKYQRENRVESGITEKKRNRKIIVSLTSYPKRIDTLWITIETLLRQTMKPDEIILWLAEEQFDGVESLPIELQNQQKRGLSIKWCDNLLSHKKYFYTMQEYPNDLVILVDDDSFYSYDLIEKLYLLHKKNPKDIVCMTPAIIYPDYISHPSLWTRPGVNEKIEHSFLAQPFTGQGTLYPPKAIPEMAFQKDVIMELCPYADDLWLKFVSLVSHTPVTAIYKCRSFPVSIYGTGASSLWHINGDAKKNDEQWDALIQCYQQEFQKFPDL